MRTQALAAITIAEGRRGPSRGHRHREQGDRADDIGRRGDQRQRTSAERPRRAVVACWAGDPLQPGDGAEQDDARHEQEPPQRVGLDRGQAEHRHHEGADQDEQRLEGPLREPLEGKDALDVDRDRHEQEPGQGGRGAGRGDEEVHWAAS